MTSIGYALSSEERTPQEPVELACVAELGQELPLPRYFRQATEALTREQVAEQVVCGGDPGPHREKIEEFADAGFDRVYVHQVGSDQEAFMRLYEREVLPAAVR